MTGQTIAEKVLSRQSLTGAPVCAGDLIDARVDGLLAIMYHGIQTAYKRAGYPEGPPVVFDRDRVYLMNEHVQPPRDYAGARSNYDAKAVAERLGLSHFYSEMGICHQMMLDYGHARPGELIVGNDSHTLSYGAVNAVSTGIGVNEAAYVWAFGELYFTVPETIKVTLEGSARPYPFAKDIMLYLAGAYGDAFAQGRSLEYTGPLAHDMDIASRLTMSAQSVELGAKFAVFEADAKTRAYVDELTDEPYTTVSADPDAVYEREITVDCDTFGFQVARPFRFDNVVPVEEVVGTRIDQARLGSCANGRFEDIEVAARMLEGRKVANGVRFYVSPASLGVYQKCVEAGLVETLLAAGVQVDRPWCAICASQVLLDEEVCITSTTRNSHGRFGGATSANAQAYLASPATVTAAAIAGEIVDPTEFLA